jgi:hypothetical protein
MQCGCLKKEKDKMAKKTIETGASPFIKIESIGSDLQIKGWDRSEILIKSSSDNELVLDEEEGRFSVSCPTDCVLYVPQEANIEIDSVGSDARVRSVFGNLTITKIGSDLAVRDTGPVTISNVGTNFIGKRINGALEIEKIGSSVTLGDVGDVNLEIIGNQLVAKRVRGDLKVSQRIGGNAVVKDIDGQVMLKSVGGSLHLQEVSGGITVDVGGNTTAEFSPVSWQVYAIETGGNVRCYVPGDVNAQFQILSGAQRIRIKTPSVSEKIDDGNYNLTLGDGDASVKITAGGNVDIATRETDWDSLKDFDIDFTKEISSMAEELADQATTQIESQLEMLENNLNVHLAGLATSISSSGLSEEKIQEIEERLEQAKERAAERATAAAEKAKMKLELKVAAAQRKADRKVRTAAARAARKARKNWGEESYPVPTSPPRKPVDPVSEEERLMILQMLQDKKISIEQAEKLLAALEGKGS